MNQNPQKRGNFAVSKMCLFGHKNTHFTQPDTSNFQEIRGISIPLPGSNPAGRASDSGPYMQENMQNRPFFMILTVPILCLSNKNNNNKEHTQ